jgi:hypothetical protein
MAISLRCDPSSRRTYLVVETPEAAISVALTADECRRLAAGLNANAERLDQPLTQFNKLGTVAAVNGRAVA